mgnify:CR=1 FL=1
MNEVNMDTFMKALLSDKTDKTPKNTIGLHP